MAGIWRLRSHRRRLRDRKRNNSFLPKAVIFQFDPSRSREILEKQGD